MPVASVVEAIGVVGLPRLIVQGLATAGEVTIGLTPALPSSMEPRGIEPTGATPGAEPAVAPPSVEGALVVPDAVLPVPQADNVDVPVVSVLMPAPSKVEEEPVVPDIPVAKLPVPDIPDIVAPDVPAARHGSALAVEP